MDGSWVLGNSRKRVRAVPRGARWEQQQGAQRRHKAGEADREAAARAKGVVLRRTPRVEAMQAAEEERPTSGAEATAVDGEQPMEDSSEEDDEAGEEEERSARGAEVEEEDGERPMEDSSEEDEEAGEVEEGRCSEEEEEEEWDGSEAAEASGEEAAEAETEAAAAEEARAAAQQGRWRRRAQGGRSGRLVRAPMQRQRRCRRRGGGSGASGRKEAVAGRRRRSSGSTRTCRRGQRRPRGQRQASGR